MSATDGPTAGPNLTTSFAYDFNTSFLNSQTDANGLVTSYAPDAAIRLRTVAYPKLGNDANANPTLETFYANAQNNPSSTDTLVYQSRFTYFDGTTQKVQMSNQWLDGVGRTIRAGSVAGPTIASFDAVKSIYDDLGRFQKSSNPYNTTNSDGDTTGLPNATVYDYDELSRVKNVTLPDANTVTTSYNGPITTVTDQVGRQRQSEADGLGRVIRVTEMDNSKQLIWDTAYSYDLNDNLTSVNQGGQTRGFKYDSLSRTTFERTPEQDAPIDDGTGTLWSAKYTYTDFNAISTRQDARGVVSTYGYDGLNRISSVSYNTADTTAQATASVSITYGSAVPKIGLVEEIKQTDSQNMVPWKENYAYDSLSRVSNKTVSFDSQAYTYTTGYGYNQAGQLTQMTYPSGRVVRYGFDDRGRMKTLGDSSSATKYVSNVGYQPSQQVGSINLGNGLTENYGYSSDRLQLTSQNVKQGANTLMSLGYNYVADKSRSGGAGTGQANTGQLMNITGSQINGQQRNESYTYDQVSRLTQASGFYSQRNYTYDRWGNRTAVSGGASQSVALQQPGGGVTNNRISSVNAGPSYQYDASGNTSYDAVHSFNYDAENRIVKVDAGATATYFYDSANRRVKRLAGGFTTYYVWEGSKVVAEYGNAPAGSGGTRFYHPDRLSSRMITDSTGTVKGTLDNVPFGEDAGTGSGESEKHRFTSYERDTESGSDYAINRQYSSSTGRFNRPDPVAGSIADPQSLNRYVYAQNDPVDLVDPLGLVVYYCPPQYSSCATVTVNVNGALYYVNVGFNGGHGTFLWSQLSFGDQAGLRFQLGDTEPPEGFDIFPTFDKFVREGSIAGQAGTKTARRSQNALAICDQVGRQAYNEYLSDPNHRLDLKFVMNRPTMVQSIENGVQIGTAAYKAIQVARSGASLTPPGAILNAMSMFGVLPSLGDLAPTWQQLLSPVERQVLDDAEAARRSARKQCRRDVKRKYGI
jgi:RHS repeat-associated protein